MLTDLQTAKWPYDTLQEIFTVTAEHFKDLLKGRIQSLKKLR